MQVQNTPSQETRDSRVEVALKFAVQVLVAGNVEELRLFTIDHLLGLHAWTKAMRPVLPQTGIPGHTVRSATELPSKAGSHLYARATRNLALKEEPMGGVVTTA